jgi:YHS domain-containing protein
MNNLRTRIENLMGRHFWTPQNANEAQRLLVQARNRPNFSMNERRYIANRINAYNMFRNNNAERRRPFYNIGNNEVALRPIRRRLNFNNENNTAMNLHGLFINTNRVKLPNNRPIDPVSLHKFRKGDAATRIRQNGKNFYFRTHVFNRLFGNNWKTMHPNSNAKISNKTNPLTRAKVLRRNVSRVKFV